MATDSSRNDLNIYFLLLSAPPPGSTPERTASFV
jgi:hypothetical protein